ncbi:MAG: hypothetical protein IPN32_24235 [Deltaproteobacteria bacterium]|nr:hypothetical protein [Deltaproteobacteria bacterium]
MSGALAIVVTEAELRAQPHRWHLRRIEVRGVWHLGFEQSPLAARWAGDAFRGGAAGASPRRPRASLRRYPARMRRHALALLTVPLASGCYQGAATDTGDGGTSTGEATTTATTASSTTAPGSSTTASTTTDAGTTTGVGPGDSSGDDGSGGGSSSTGYDPGIEGDGDYEIGPDYVDAPEIVPGEGCRAATSTTSRWTRPTARSFPA